MNRRPDYSQCSRYRHGFTLIELLVVISIIALLVSILLPSLQRARQQALAVVCMANFTQIGISVQMYADDNVGIIVPYAYTWRRADGATPTRLFPYLLRDYAPVVPKEQKGKNIYMCSVKTDFLVYDGAWYQTNYALNSVISPHSWYAPVRKMTSVKRPSECLSGADSGNFYGRVSPYSSHPDLYPPEYRHSGSVNCLFLDGHVSDRKQQNPFPEEETNGFWDGH